MLKHCKRCLLPSTMPGLSISEDDLCDICQITPPVSEIKENQKRLRKEMDDVISRCRGASPYEVVVAYSGGKDSSYTLKMLVEEYGLRVIAVTIDNGFLGHSVMDNCKAVCGSLGVDHILFTPSKSFTETLYKRSVEDSSLHSKASIKRASSICASCIMMINTHMLQKAVQLKAPIVAGGYIGGQVPRDGAVMSIKPGRQSSMRDKAVDRFESSVGHNARQYFSLPTEGLDAEREIIVINPMLGLSISEEDIIKALEPMGWKRPKDTGRTSTNCRLNDLGVYIHSNKYKFHPYAMEVAEQLRGGTMTREKAEKKLNILPTRIEVTELAHQIGLSDDNF